MNQFTKKVSILLLLVFQIVTSKALAETQRHPNTFEVVWAEKDETGVYFRQKSYPSVVRFFPARKYITATINPVPDGAARTSISVNLYLSGVDLSVQKEKYKNIEGISFAPIQLKKSEGCNFTRTNKVEHVIGVSEVPAPETNEYGGVRGQYICSFSVLIEGAHQDKVISDLNALLEENAIFNDLFSINFNKIESQAVVSWQDVFEQVKGKFTERKALNRDVATFVAGIAVGELESSKQWWLGASKKEQDRFVSEAVLKLYTPVNGNFLLNDAVDDSRFMEEKSSSFQVKI
jgi:hypothetical protein